MMKCKKVLLLALAWFTFALAASAQEEGAKSPYGHDFPEMFAVQKDWNEYQRDPSSLPAIQTLLQKDAEGKHAVALAEPTYTSIWTTIDRWLKQHPESVAALRIEQNSASPAQLFVAMRSGDPARMMEVYRSYPWADVVHQSQLEYAESLLRQGRPQLALRCFQDVLERGEEATLLARARAGSWLATSHTIDSPERIKAMFRGIDPAARFPWFGKQLSATEIEAKLIVGLPPAPVWPKLDALSIREIQLPDDSPWIGSKPWIYATTARELLYRHKVLPVVSGRGTVVAGPCLVAWYDDKTLDAPTWTKIATMDVCENVDSKIPPVPPFDPLVADGRIIVRCGNDIADPNQKRSVLFSGDGGRGKMYLLSNLAAFDRRSGQMLWNTSADPTWADFFPVKAPVHAEGRLYLLAAHARSIRPGSGGLAGVQEPIFLIIADAATGHILHQRELVAFRSTFQPHNPRPDQPSPPRKERKLNLSAQGDQRGFGGRVDLHHYGNRLTVKDGAVYCTTAMGAVARCDARDGLIEWITIYPQLSSNWNDMAVMVRRHGAEPLVGEKAVVFSPRDSVAIFAVDRETGIQLWQKTTIEDEAVVEPNDAEQGQGPADDTLEDGSLEALGVYGDAVLVTFDRRIAALDLATGKVRWTRELADPVERPIKIVGNALYLATAIDLMQLDGTTGNTLASRDLAPLRTDTGFVFDDEGLIVVRAGKYGITSAGIPGE